MPQQLPVVQLLEGTETLALALPPNFEDLGGGWVGGWGKKRQTQQKMYIFNAEQQETGRRKSHSVA